MASLALSASTLVVCGTAGEAHRDLDDAAGCEIDAELRAAQVKLDEASRAAREDVRAGLGEIEQALKSVLEDAGAALEDAWSAVMGLL